MPPLPDEIKKLLSALQTVVENDSFRTTLKDTLEVAKEIDDLKATKRTQDRERFDLETQLDKWQRGNKRLREQLALSQTGLQKGTETVNGLKNELRIEKENNKAGLQSLTTAAKAAERRVKQLEGYMTSLQAVSPENMYVPAPVSMISLRRGQSAEPRAWVAKDNSAPSSRMHAN